MFSRQSQIHDRMGYADMFTLAVNNAGYEVVKFFFIDKGNVGSGVRVFPMVNVNGLVYAKATYVFNQRVAEKPSIFP